MVGDRSSKTLGILDVVSYMLCRGFYVIIKGVTIIKMFKGGTVRKLPTNSNFVESLETWIVKFGACQNISFFEMNILHCNHLVHELYPGNIYV